MREEDNPMEEGGRGASDRGGREGGDGWMMERGRKGRAPERGGRVRDGEGDCS